MKKLLFVLTLLTSMSSFASANFIEAKYNIGTECELLVSTGDYFNTNVKRLIVEMGVNKITPWGAVLTQRLESSIEQVKKRGYVELDNAAGMGTFVIASVFFDENGMVTKFKAQKTNPEGAALSEVLNCNEMEEE